MTTGEIIAGVLQLIIIVIAICIDDD